jgi:hypothetical protein
VDPVCLGRAGPCPDHRGGMFSSSNFPKSMAEMLQQELQYWAKRVVDGIAELRDLGLRKTEKSFSASPMYD